MTSDDSSSAPAIPAASAARKAAAMYVVWAIDGTVVSASDSYAQLIGWTAEEIIGQRWPDLVPAEASFAWQQLQFSVEALRHAPVLVVDMPTQASGDTQWLRWTEWAIRDTEGELVQVRSTAVDVSELHETRAVLAATVDAVAAARAAGRQEVLEQLHNGAIQQLTAARWAISDGDLLGSLGLIDAALNAVSSSMDVLDPPQVEVPLVSTSPLPANWVGESPVLRQDDVPSWLTDVAVSSVADAVMVFSSTEVVWASPPARAMFAEGEGHIDLASLVAMVHPDDRAAMAQALTTCLAGEAARLHWRFRMPPQCWRHLSTRFVPISLPDGRTAAAAVTIDIDDGVTRAEQRARRAARDRLAADLHDDALQQLAGVRWLLTSQGADDAVMAELARLEESLRGQVGELLSVVQEVGLAAALERVLDEIATPTTLTLGDDLEALPFETADGAWRVTRELLRNVDRHASATRATADVRLESTSMIIRVEDDGVGFSTDAWAEARRSGHVGLTTLRELAFRSGGSFEIGAGAEGRGTRVTVSLPVD